jgi:hypothetical protein
MGRGAARAAQQLAELAPGRCPPGRALPESTPAGSPRTPQQPPPPLRDRAPRRAARRGRRQPPLRLAARGHQVRQALNLSQVELASLVGAPRELPRRRGPQAQRRRRRSERRRSGGDCRGAAVQVKLGAGLAGEAAGRREAHDQRPIEGHAATGTCCATGAGGAF